MYRCCGGRLQQEDPLIISFTCKEIKWLDILHVNAAQLRAVSAHWSSTQLDFTESNSTYRNILSPSLSGSLECGGRGTQGSVWVGNRAHVIWSAHLPLLRLHALNQYSAKLSLVFTFTWLLPWCAARVEQPLPNFCGTCPPPSSLSSSFTSLHFTSWQTPSFRWLQGDAPIPFVSCVNGRRQE